METGNTKHTYAEQANKVVSRGDIYFVDNLPSVGNECSGARPGIVVSNDIGNKYSPLVVVVFLTTKEKKPLPTHVKISSSSKPSTAMCEQIATVHKSRLGSYIGQITLEEMTALEKALGVSLEFDPNIKVSKFVESWEKAYKEFVEEEKKTDVKNKPGEMTAKDMTEESDSKRKTTPQAVKTNCTSSVDDSYHAKLVELQTECRIYKELYYNLLSKLS